MQVVWLRPPAEASDDLAALAIASVDDIPADAAVAIVDTRTVAPGEVAAALAQFPGIAVVRCDDAELTEVLAAVGEEVDVALRGEPRALFHRRIRSAMARAFPLRDGLTGLLTRRAFTAELERAAAGASPAHPVSVIALDVDHFKRLNDTHGHAAGDRVLVELAARLRRLVPTGAALARMGGEELAMFGLMSADQAGALAEAMRSAVEAAPLAEIAVTISAGVATCDVAGGASELLRQADAATYAAKASGRNQTVQYRHLRRRAAEADRDVEVEVFELSTRILTEKVADVIARRGRRLFDELRERADVDALTGLYSRRYLDRRLGFELEERPGDVAIAVALLDLDGFGGVNKQHGWPTGDRVLADVGARIRAAVRADDWVARYGGEEICVVMHGIDVAQATAILERLRAAVADHPFVTTGGDPLAVTVSIGVAVRAPGESMAGLLERASARLLDAKRGGKNQVCG